MPNLGNNMASPASNISRRHSALRWSLALLLIFPSHVASAAFVSQGRQQPHHSTPHRSMYRSNVIVPERSMIASAKSEVRGALWTPNGAAMSPPLLHMAVLSENNNAEHGGKMGKRRRLRAALSGLLGRPGRRRRLRQAVVSSAAGLALGLVMMNPRSVDAAAAAAARASAVAAPSAKTQGPGSGDGRSSPTKIIVVGAAAAVGTAYGRGVILTKDDDADDGESRKRKRDVFNKIMGITKKEDGGSETTTTTKNANDLKIEKDLKRQAFELNKELNNEAEEMREERIQMELKAAEKKMGLDGTKTKAMPASSTSSGVDMADKKGAADSIGAAEREASLRKVQEEEDLQKKKEAFDKAREEEERKIRAKADKLERERLEIERKAAERAAAEKRAAEEARLAAEKAEQARIAEAERALERQRHEEARRAAEQKATEEARAAEEKRKAERAAAEKLLEEKKAEAEKKWIEERMNVEEAKVAVKQMNQQQQQQQQQQSRSSTSYVQKPRNAKEDKRMSENYASMDLEERAFNILLDLGMISQSPDPSDPSYDPSSDHLFAPENIFKE